MGPVIYSMGVSLDGFIAGPDGAIDWAAPDEELMRFHNEQTRQLGAHLCGRGLYQDMLPWETAGESRSDPNELEFARIWKALPKVVFSSTLETVQATPGWPPAVSPRSWQRSRSSHRRTCPSASAAPASPPPWSSWT